MYYCDLKIFRCILTRLRLENIVYYFYPENITFFWSNMSTLVISHFEPPNIYKILKRNLNFEHTFLIITTYTLHDCIIPIKP